MKQPIVDLNLPASPGIKARSEQYYERALQKSESRYRQLIENLQAAIYTTDAEGHITLYNKAAADLWGREPEIGKDMWCGSYKIYNTDGSDLPLDDCPMARTLREGRPVTGAEIIVVRPDGAMLNVAPHPQPVFDDDGKIIGAINMLVDITAIRLSEKALRESEKELVKMNNLLEKKVEERTSDLVMKNEELKRSEERYHKMIDEVEDYAIVLLDPSGIIQNWNKGAEKIKGYKEEEIVGKSFRNFYREVDREKGLPEMLLEQARTMGKAIHEGWRLRKDGSIFWGSIVITALHDDEKNIVGFSKVTRDLTARKWAEDKMVEYTNKLEFQNKELEQFAYAASHDMKEPLRKISFYNSYVAEAPATELDDKSKDYLNRSISSVRKMSKLVDDLLTYSKTNAVFESFKKTDLNELLNEVLISHKDIFEENQVSVHVDPLPTMSVIPFQFKQLLDNIIGNAIKYRDPKKDSEITITSEMIHGIDINNNDADDKLDYYKISVADNGIGFESKYADKIFEVFQRLNNDSSYKGSGIGLAICKKIVQNHNGFIEAIGKENEGARFDIYIPKK